MNIRKSVTDLPLVEKSDDLLNLNKYAQGLYEFIKNTETPMSIAIQGDWGTGKTSILNLIKNLNKETKNGKTLQTFYINTWQFSQFTDSSNLYFAFLSSLIKQMGLNSEEAKATVKNLAKVAFLVGKGVLSYSGMGNVNNFLDEIEKVATNVDNQITEIEKSKDTFIKLINTYRNKKKIEKLVILVDDLDRLSPKTAVDLLEAIKLFLDVEYCVFVLAIDYDVVVQGVHEKFGDHISNEKCKSFFDKIIQLPFRLPVESYSSEQIFRKYIDTESISDEHLSLVSTFVDNSVGANPRTLKRIINAFILIEYITNQTGDSFESSKGLSVYNSLLLLFLPIQMHYCDIYTALVSLLKGNGNGDLFDNFEDKLVESIRKNAKLDDFSDIIRTTNDLAKTAKEIISSSKDFESVLSKVIQMTSITSVSNNVIERNRGASTKVDRIEIFGKSIKVDTTNASDALSMTIENLMEANPEKAGSIQSLKFIRVNNSGDNNSIFRTSKKIEFHGTKYFIATSTGISDKKKQINELCRLLNINDETVKWFCNDEVIYEYSNRKNCTI